MGTDSRKRDALPTSSSPSERALAATGISGRYGETARFAIDDVSFDLNRGELVAVLGPNGAGKTTLVRLVSGIQQIVAGEVRIFGAPIASIDRTALAKKVAVVRQSEPIA